MAAMDPNFDDFLNKVDELESIVKGFRSEEEKDVSQAISRADDLIAKVKNAKKGEIIKIDKEDKDLPVTRTGFNKTSINKSVDDDLPGQNDVNFDGMDQSGFMHAVEADAKERAGRRRERMKLAEELKEKGNVEFRQGNFEQALDFYTQGLREMKDNTALYTNRAQTYMKLGKFPEAFIDCEWALRVFPNCIKAHIHMGRAHIGMKEYTEARECFKKALTCDPKKETLINDYLAEVDRKELADRQEETAAELLKGGNPEDLGVVEILKRVQNPEQLPVFYSGGFRMLKGLLNDTPHRTLFRTSGGLEMVHTLPILQKALSASPKSLSGEELDMLTSAFDLYTEACRDNEKSTEQFLQQDNIPESCTHFLTVKMKGQGRLLQHAITNCLYTMSQLNIGQRCIVTLFDIPKLLSLMFSLIRTSTKSSTAAANLLSNLALDIKFKSLLRDKVDVTVCPAFEQLLRESESSTVLPRCITMVTNLTSDTTIRSKLMNRKELRETCSNTFVVHKQKLDDKLSAEIVECVLGLLLNLTTASSPGEEQNGPVLCENCLAMLTTRPACPLPLQQRGVALLSHVLPHCTPAVEVIVKNGGLPVLFDYLKAEGMLCRSALKSLTALTQHSEEARIYVTQNKGIGLLVSQLKSEDEVVIGNAALCLSHCTQVPKVCTKLTKTDIIKELLVFARDGRRPAVQENCAILIAKLAQGDTKHLERLRELHGIEILHSCMKYIHA